MLTVALQVESPDDGTFHVTIKITNVDKNNKPVY